MMVDRKWPAWKGFAMFGDEKSTVDRLPIHVDQSSNEIQGQRDSWYALTAFFPFPEVLHPYPFPLAAASKGPTEAFEPSILAAEVAADGESDRICRRR